jgi:hypothetical protein
MAFITAETRSDLIALAVGMLKQAPSNTLLDELIALSVEGGSLADAADHIAKTDAFKAEDPSFQTAEQYATEIFDNITTGGTVTAGIRTAVIELATGFLTSGEFSKSGLAQAIVDFLSQPAALLNDDFADIAQSVQNRSAAAEYFVVTKELGGSTDAELAAAIASVTSDADTLTAANAAADVTADAEEVVAGQTFTLTTSDDVADSFSSSRGNLANTFAFTDASETVRAGVGTLGNNDILIDDATDDSDVIEMTAGTLGTATLTNIETIKATFASGTPVLQLDNVTGTDTVFISGAVSGTVDGFSAQHDALAPKFALDGFGKTLTINPATLAGTLAAETNEVINLWVSGTTYGAAAANSSTVTVDGAVNGQLEVLNIESAGSALNTFLLTAAANDAFGDINISGATPVVVIMGAAQATGLDIVGAAGSSAIVSADVNGSATLDMSDYVNVTTVVADSVLSSSETPSLTVANGQAVTFANDFGATSASMQNTTTKVQGGSFSITLDNTKDDADVDLTSFGLSNVKALNIVSNGDASDESTTAANSIGNTTGKFNTITVTGDTSLALTDISISGTGTKTIGPRAVTVDATGMTGVAFLTANVSSNAYDTVSYTVKGTDNNDTLTVETTDKAGVTLEGNGGDDALTGALGADTIDGGAGDDTITLTYGADTVTGGAGIDTFDVGSSRTGTATAQVSLISSLSSTLDNGSLTDIAASNTNGDLFVVTVNGMEYSLGVVTDGDDEDDIYGDFIDDNGADLDASILADHGVTVTYTAGTNSYYNTFYVTGAGLVAIGDTVVIDKTQGGIAADVTFTYSDAGVWESDTDDWTLDQDGTEFTVTTDAAYTVAEATSLVDIAAQNGGIAAKIDIDGDSDVTGTVDPSITAANGYLAFSGRSDGAAFSVSAVFKDNTKATAVDGLGNAVVTNVYTDRAVSTTAYTAAAAAPDLDTTITDIDADDIIDVDQIITGDVQIATSLLDANLATATVIILTESTYATFGAAEAAVTAAINDANNTSDALIIWESSVTGAIDMYFDDDIGSTDLDTTAEQTAATILSFTGVTTSDLGTILSVDSFQFG